MAPSLGNDLEARPMVQYQFVTLIATILLVGVGLATAFSILMDSRFEVVDARFKQVDARFEQVDARFERVENRMDRMENRMDQLERRMDDGFREMAVAIARIEGLIQGFHGTATTNAASAAEEGPAAQGRHDPESSGETHAGVDAAPAPAS